MRRGGVGWGGGAASGWRSGAIGTARHGHGNGINFGEAHTQGNKAYATVADRHAISDRDED